MSHCWHSRSCLGFLPVLEGNGQLQAGKFCAGVIPLYICPWHFGIKQSLQDIQSYKHCCKGLCDWVQLHSLEEKPAKNSQPASLYKRDLLQDKLTWHKLHVNRWLLIIIAAVIFQFYALKAHREDSLILKGFDSGSMWSKKKVFCFVT